MSLPRNLKTPTYHATTIGTIFTNSSGSLNLILDSCEVGLTDTQTLSLAQDDSAKYISLISEPEKYEYETTATVKEKGYFGKTYFSGAIDFHLDEIDSILLETRPFDSTTYTTRADVSSLNIFADTQTDIWYLRITITRDAGYATGFTTVFLRPAPLTE
jgi:hypothetical protein